MPDFAPSFTPRYIVTYRSARRVHNIMMRGLITETESATVTRGQTYIHALFLSLAGKLPDDLTFISARYIPAGSEVSSPAGTPEDVTGALDVDTFSKEDGARFLRFACKGNSGVKGNITVFGVQLSPDTVPDNIASDFVITASEDTDVAGAIAALQASGAPVINGSVATWYNQATTKAHDLYIKKIRKGS